MKNRLPENDDMEKMDNRNHAQKNAVNPEDVQHLQKMGEKIHLVLRMAAMDMLEETASVPEGGTFFDAYLALEEKCGDDWSTLERVVDTLWTQEAIRMVMDSGKYIAVWRALRMRIIAEALSLLKKFEGEEKTKEDSKFFTIIGLHICEKVINTLSRSDEKGN